MKRSRGTTVYGTLIIISGTYNLIGIGNYKHFALMFQPLLPALIMSVYLFTILYGICGVYCGTKILKLEDWARKFIVGLTAISVISGFFLNKLVMTNFKTFLMLPESHIAPDIAGSVYTYAVVLTALVTIFELSVIYYLTRPGVVQQFKS